MELTISQAVYNQVISYGESDKANEVCGAFLGTKRTATEWTCDEFIPMRNISQKGRGSNYTPDPNELFKVLSQTTHMNRDAKKDLIGIFHTHPHHAPIPSSIDVHGAGYKGFYMIYSPKYTDEKTYFFDGQTPEFTPTTLIVKDTQ
ncbi:MAG: Mov34/MPN/PAD-1 family protein [Rhodobacteraceae bacterium]|nr:Mov34/MPN/PAD-1 family protein [Paracoccaceae bacterium]